MSPKSVCWKSRTRWVGALALLWVNLLATAADVTRGPAVSNRYEPACADVACQAWRDFRAQRPFPVQTIAARIVGDRLVLVFSEPTLPRAELATVLRHAFGSDMLSLASQRWSIGVDGWLEDAVLSVKWSGAEKAGDLLRRPELRDRLSVVGQRLWGTSYGLAVEAIDADYQARARAAAPNLDPRPNELHAWLREPGQLWRPLDSLGQPASLQVVQSGAGGVYAGSNGRLNLLVLPAAAVALASSDPNAFAARWRTVFRHFAVASDVVVGAHWSGSAALVIVGRQRRVPAEVMPPLRFETFAVLADVDARQLAQSYERTTAFAGKLHEGDYAMTDWAPIYLSDPLIDTEFGALLNITDQMLKSWSLAGDVEYLHFDYPLRPAAGKFAFGAEPISSLIQRETGSRQVLFNWNTSGAASISRIGDVQVLVPAATGALPVTYGAELTRGEGVVTGQGTTLLGFENKAYRFFAGLRDPNLARVVSYTVLYQALTAYKAERAGAAVDDGAVAARFQNRPAVKARHAATRLLVDELAAVIDNLSRPDAERRLVDSAGQNAQKNLEGTEDMTEESRQLLLKIAGAVVKDLLGDTPERLQRLRARYPALKDAKAMARLMVDRAEVPRLWRPLMARNLEYRKEVRRYNDGVQAGTLTVAVGKPWRARLETEEKALGAQLREMQDLQTEVSRASRQLVRVLSLVRSIDAVRERYVALAAAPPDGWIRTPSIVMSWGTEDVEAVGGHNLDASALRIQVQADLKEAVLERAAGGKVLKVPAAQAESAHANAALLARRIEHEGLDAPAVRSLLNTAPRLEARPIETALQLDGAAPAAPQVSRYAGRQVLDDGGLRTQMVSNFDSYGRPSMLVTRDADGYFIVVTRNGQVASCCLRVLDFATLRDTIVARQSGGAGDVVLVNFNERQARALRMNLKGRDDQVMLEAVGGSGGGGRQPPDGTVHVLRDDGPEGSGASGRDGSNGGGSDRSGPPGTPPGGEGRDGSGPYLVGLLPERGSPLEAIQASHVARHIDAVGGRVEGEDAMKVIARMQDQTRGPLARRQLQWDPGTQGDPVVFRLSWTEAGGGRSEVQGSNLIAGVDPTNRAAGMQAVADAVARAGAERPQQSLSQFHARVKELVDKHRDGKWVWTLLHWVEELRVSYLLSQAEDLEAPAP